MKKFIILFAFIFSGIVFGQVQEKIYGNKEPYEQAETVPEFSSGIENFKNQFYKNLSASKFINNSDIYEAKLEFMIEKQGNITSIKCKGDNKRFNLEVENALKKIKTKWKPAINDNKKVRYHITMPIFYSRKEFVTNHLEDDFFGEKKINANKIFTEVDEGAEFLGGINKFKNIVKSKLDESTQNYSFEMNFIIEINGTISNIKISGTDTTKDENIINIVTNINDKWIPAKINSQKVRSFFTLQFP